jgi:N-dimethylarginine dimethylaminohydrolase
LARVFLMSPPPPGWRITGGANYKSNARPAVNPRKAMQEWLALADAVLASGAEVCVLPPPAPPALLSGLMYTANAGWLVTADRFEVANLSVGHRKAEQVYLREVLPGLLGLSVEVSTAVWEGQADMCTLGPSSVILSYGVRSVVESAAEVEGLLPPGALTQAARLREPFFHGDTCMDLVETPSGSAWLVFPGAFAAEEEYLDARAFAEREAEVLEISQGDALAYACNSLSLGRSLLVPEGLSAELTGRLVARGVEPRPLDFGELFGKGGGGPRCLVNELRGLERPPPGTSYREKRGELLDAVAGYPTAT